MREGKPRCRINTKVSYLDAIVKFLRVPVARRSEEGMPLAAHNILAGNWMRGCRGQPAQIGQNRSTLSVANIRIIGYTLNGF